MPRSTTSRWCWSSPEAGLAVHILGFDQQGSAAERDASRTAAGICVRRVLGRELGNARVEIEADGWRAPWARVDGSRIPLSLSHTKGYAAAAAHRWARVGIDVEEDREIPGRFARYFVSPADAEALEGWGHRPTALLAAWTLKEAALKSLGRGLSVPPRAVRIHSIGAGGKARMSWEDTRLGAACWRERDAVVALAWAGGMDLPPLLLSRGRG